MLRLDVGCLVFGALKMPHRMRATTQAKGRECAHASLKYFEASVTIVVRGVDIDITLLVNLRRFIEDHCIVRSCAVERGGALTHKHFQMMLKGNFRNLLVLNKKIKVALGCHVDPLTGHVVSCKKLRDEGLHTFGGMVGYCMKDNGQDHFEKMCQLVSQQHFAMCSSMGKIPHEEAFRC